MYNTYPMNVGWGRMYLVTLLYKLLLSQSIQGPSDYASLRLLRCKSRGTDPVHFQKNQQEKVSPGHSTPFLYTSTPLMPKRNIVIRFYILYNTPINSLATRTCVENTNQQNSKQFFYMNDKFQIAHKISHSRLLRKHTHTNQ